VFFALWPEAAVAKRLAAWAAMTAPAQARCMRRDTLHLTLAFVGDIDADRLPAVFEAGDAVAWPRVLMQVDQMSYWSHNHIIWAGMSEVPEALSRLAGDLSDALGVRGFELSARAFTPHVTLVRKAAGMNAPADFEPIRWRVADGVLVVSERTHEGARYRVLKHWSAHAPTP